MFALQLYIGSALRGIGTSLQGRQKDDDLNSKSFCSRVSNAFGDIIPAWNDCIIMLNLEKHSQIHGHIFQLRLVNCWMISFF